MGDNHKTFSNKRRMMVMRADKCKKRDLMTMYRQGKNLEDIAQRFKISVASVKTLLKEWGVDISVKRKKSKDRCNTIIHNTNDCLYTNDSTMLENTQNVRYTDISNFIKHINRSSI